MMWIDLRQFDCFDLPNCTMHYALNSFECTVLNAPYADVPEIVLKAQVHAGGRGKGTFSSGLKSGVHLTKE